MSGNINKGLTGFLCDRGAIWLQRRHAEDRRSSASRRRWEDEREHGGIEGYGVRLQTVVGEEEEI